MLKCIKTFCEIWFWSFALLRCILACYFLPPLYYFLFGRVCLSYNTHTPLLLLLARSILLKNNWIERICPCDVRGSFRKLLQDTNALIATWDCCLYVATASRVYHCLTPTQTNRWVGMHGITNWKYNNIPLQKWHMVLRLQRIITSVMRGAKLCLVWR